MYRTVSGFKWVQGPLGFPIREPWSVTYEIGGPDDPDPVRSQLREIRDRFKAVCKRAKELDLYTYKVLEEDEVPQENRKAAQAALELAAAVGKVPWPVKIGWILPESTEERSRAWRNGSGWRPYDTVLSDDLIWGKTKTYADQIWVLADLSPRDTAWVTLHEVRHVTQSLDVAMADREREADAFAYNMVRHVRLR